MCSLLLQWFTEQSLTLAELCIQPSLCQHLHRVSRYKPPVFVWFIYLQRTDPALCKYRWVPYLPTGLIFFQCLAQITNQAEKWKYRYDTRFLIEAEERQYKEHYFVVHANHYFVRGIFRLEMSISGSGTVHMQDMCISWLISIIGGAESEPLLSVPSSPQLCQPTDRLTAASCSAPSASTSGYGTATGPAEGSCSGGSAAVSSSGSAAQGSGSTSSKQIGEQCCEFGRLLSRSDLEVRIRILNKTNLIYFKY